MKHTPTSRETLLGFSYLAFQFLLLPALLIHGNEALPQPLTEAQLNFVFYGINGLAALLIFHRLLWDGVLQALQQPRLFLWVIPMGFLLYGGCRTLISWLLPDFSNRNDAAIAAMLQDSPRLVYMGTVLLVPVYEECIYRGLIFGKLREKSLPAAYLISALIFAGIHILGYMGQYSAEELLFATVQYLPAGLCLGWVYEQSGSILAPISLHALINFFTLSSMR